MKEIIEIGSIGQIIMFGIVVLFGWGHWNEGEFAGDREYYFKTEQFWYWIVNNNEMLVALTVFSILYLLRSLSKKLIKWPKLK